MNISKKRASKKIINTNVADIKGNNNEDIIYLVGEEIEGEKNILYKNIEIIISDGENGKLTYIDLNSISGYNPKIVLDRFTSSKKKSIFFNIDEEGNNSNRTIIYTVDKETVKLIFDSNIYFENKKYEVNYKDNYKVNLLDIDNNKEYSINIENKDYNDLRSIYNSKGMVRSISMGDVLRPYNVLLIKENSKEKIDLLVKQRIIGDSLKVNIGEIITFLSFEDDKCIEKSKNVSIEYNNKALRKEEIKDSKYDFSNVNFIESETIPNIFIENAIEKEFLLTPKRDKVNYLYNMVNLNTKNYNKKDDYEVIVYLEGPKFCNERGGTAVILEKKNNQYIANSIISGIVPPIIICDNNNSVYKDLIVRFLNNGKYDFRVLKYNGNSYPINPTKEYKLKNEDKIKGVAVISDDLFFNKGFEY